MSFCLLRFSYSDSFMYQVEFYFSDSNLPRDNFLMKTINESDDGSIFFLFFFLAFIFASIKLA